MTLPHYWFGPPNCYCPCPNCFNCPNEEVFLESASFAFTLPDVCIIWSGNSGTMRKTILTGCAPASGTHVIAFNNNPFGSPPYCQPIHPSPTIVPITFERYDYGPTPSCVDAAGPGTLIASGSSNMGVSFSVAYSGGAVWPKSKSSKISSIMCVVGPFDQGQFIFISTTACTGSNSTSASFPNASCPELGTSVTAAYSPTLA